MRRPRKLPSKREILRSGLPEIETTGEILSNNSLIDLCRSDSGNLELILIDGKSYSIGSQINTSAAIFIPPASGDDVLKAIRLPNNPTAYGSTKKLLSELQGLFKLDPGLPDESVSILAC